MDHHNLPMSSSILFTWSPEWYDLQSRLSILSDLEISPDQLGCYMCLNPLIKSLDTIDLQLLLGLSNLQLSLERSNRTWNCSVNYRLSNCRLNNRMGCWAFIAPSIRSNVEFLISERWDLEVLFEYSESDIDCFCHCGCWYLLKVMRYVCMNA